MEDISQAREASGGDSVVSESLPARPDGDDALFSYSTVNRAADNKPKSVRETRGKFRKRFARPEIRGNRTLIEYLGLGKKEQHEQKDGAGWIPAILDGKGRTDDNVVSISAIVLDLDNKTGRPIGLDEIKRKLKGFAFIAHTSYSHAPGYEGGNERWRVIVFLQHEIPESRFLAVWTWFNNLFNGRIDQACKNPSRFYYRPSCPSDAVALYQCHIQEGELFNPDLVEVTPGSLPGSAEPAELPDNFEPVDVDKLRVDAWVKDLIRVGKTNSDEYPSRSEAVYAVVCALIEAGCDDATIAGMLLEPANGISEKPLEQRDPRGWVASEIKRAREKAKDKGQPKKKRQDAQDRGFVVDDKGVWYRPPDEPDINIWICDRLDVTAYTCDATSENHGRLLEFTDPAGVKHSWAMPMSLLAGDGTAFRGELMSMGLSISTNRRARELLAVYIQTAKPERWIQIVEHTGWCGHSFVLPDGTIGDSEDVRVQLQTVTRLKSYRTVGTLEEWKQHVGALCAGNSRLVFAVAASLVAPLLHLIGEENGGAHFRGVSSTGKTTMLFVAGSTWGDQDYIQSWRSTVNGLEAVAVSHNDGLLCLDELKQVNPNEAGETAYLLANGRGKQRANRAGQARDRQSWRVFFLSTGEISLADHSRSAGKRTHGGEEVRLVDIPADAGCGLGVFENLHGYKGGREFAEALREHTRRYHGTVIREYLRRITADMDSIKASIQELRESVYAQLVPPQASGQVQRVAARFALVALAGEIGTILGVTGWTDGEAVQATHTCFDAWITSRGGTEAQEETAMLSQVRRFLELHGESRFTSFYDDGSITASAGMGTDHRVTINRAGFRRTSADGLTDYLILPEVFRADVCAGFDYRQVAKLLKDRGCLKTDSQGKSQVNHRLPGMGQKKVYWIRSTIFTDLSDISQKTGNTGNDG